MRTLSDTLLTAQKGDGSTPPYVRVHLISAGGTGGTTATYTTSDALNRMPPYHQSVLQREEVYGGVAIVSLLNNDGHFNSLNFKGYSIDIGWGFGTEYSNSPRMFVIGQKEVSVAGQVYTQLLCTDMWNMLGKSEIFAGGKCLTGTISGSADAIGEKITQGAAYGTIVWVGSGLVHVAGVSGTFVVGAAASTSLSIAITAITDIGAGGSTLAWNGDTTVKNIITALLAGWTTITLDSDDPSGSFNTYKPTYIVPLGTDIRTVIKDMLEFTECGMIMKSDGMHAKYIDPAPSADYTYNMSTEHNFLSGSRDRRLVTPNRIAVVAIPPTEGVNLFVGVATDADSYAQLGKYLTRIIVLDTVGSQADADARATAIINRTKAEMNSGELLLPLMNVGQELLDWVTVTDERNQSIVYSGRVGMIEREYADGRFGMTIGLGNISSAAGLDDAGVVTPGGSVPTVGSADTIVDEIPASRLAPGAQAYICDLRFTSVDWDTVSWPACTLTLKSGNTQAIGGGTQDFANANPYYAFFIWDNPTLQWTQSYGSCIGEDRGLVGTCKRGTSTTDKAYAQNFFNDSILINRDKVMDNLVTELQLANDAVSQAKIQASAVGSNQLAAGSVVAGKIAALAIAAGNIQADAVTAQKIYAGAVTAVKIDAGAIDATKLAATMVLATTIWAGNNKVKISPDGIDTYGQFFRLRDSAGNLKGDVWWSAADGAITIKGQASGAGVRLDANAANIVLAMASGYYLTVGGSGVRPPTVNTGYVGTSDQYWYAVYGNYLMYKTHSAFDHKDDFAMIKNIKPDKKDPSKVDKSTLPDEVLEKMPDGDHFIRTGDMMGLLQGTLKKLIIRVESLEAELAKYKGGK